AVAVNPVSNKIYVANTGSYNASVIDGASNATITVGAGTFPVAVGVNTITNKIYVANSGSSNVSVIDGSTNSTATVSAGLRPQDVSVNLVTNTTYLANFGTFVGACCPYDPGSVSIIDGASDAAMNVVDGNAVSPRNLAVNPITNKTYVADFDSSNLTVIDGATRTIAATLPLA